VQGRVALLGGSVDLGAPLEQLSHDVDVSLLGGQMEGVEAVGIARVDVQVALEVLQHLLQVAAASGAQEGRVVIALQQ